MDTFLIKITDPGSFLSTTDEQIDDSASSDLNFSTELFLLDRDGDPVMANDDLSENEGATLPSDPDDFTSFPGSFGHVDSNIPECVAGAIYGLVISGFDNAPEDAQMNDLFEPLEPPDVLWGPNPSDGAFDYSERSYRY